MVGEAGHAHPEEQQAHTSRAKGLQVKIKSLARFFKTILSFTIPCMVIKERGDI